MLNRIDYDPQAYCTQIAWIYNLQAYFAQIAWIYVPQAYCAQSILR